MNETFSVRSYQPEDAALLAEIFMRAITEIGPKDYSPDQVAAWAARAPSADDLHSKMGDGRTRLVALDRNGPVAFCDLEDDGHIDLLYCAPEAAGRGASRHLYVQIEAYGRGQGLSRFYTEASAMARRFFLRQGFQEIGRRDFLIGDTKIHNFAMEKTLGG